MTIQKKLLAAFVALSAAAVIAAVIGTNYAVRQAANAKMKADLETAVKEFQALVESLQGDLAFAVSASLTEADVARTYSASNDDQGEALGLGGSDEGALDTAHELAKSADLKLLKVNDILVFVNARGRLFYTHADRAQKDQDLAAVPIIKDALAGAPTKDLWSAAFVRSLEQQTGVRMLVGAPDDDLFVVYATPYSRGGHLFGGVLIGRRVKPSLLPKLEQLARAKVVLRARDEMAISTFPNLANLSKEAWSGQTVPVSVDGTAYLALAGKVERPGGDATATALLLREVDADVKPIVSRFWAALPGVLGVSLAVSLALAMVLSRRMARPLVRLADAAKKVRRGDLAVQVPVESRDELGRLAASFNEMVDGLRQRDEIKGLFKRYLDPQVVEELIRHPEKASPGGERRDLTVLFSDLVGFTSISERLSPEALVAMLNDYFEAASRELAANGATFDKFIGDAIMCFWNAPLPQEDHAARACRTAVGLLRVVEQFGASQGGGAERLRCRIGINSGPCIVGNIGSKAAQDYTVVGDTVNLASRLESAAKIYGTRSLVSETTIAAAAGAVVTRELDILKVRGRGQPVRVYELVGLPGTLLPLPMGRYAEGLGLYRERRFQEALKAFEASPDDPPSVVFVERCRKMIAQPPPDDWAGVYEVHG